MDFSKVRNYLFIALLLVVTGTFFWILKIFIYPLFWAAVIAALFYPAYQRLNRFFKHPGVSSGLSVIIISLIILIPLSVLGTLLLRESLTIYNQLNTDQGSVSATIEEINRAIKNHPLTAHLNIDEQFVTEKVSEISVYLINFLLNGLKLVTQNSLEFIIMFILTMYTVFFFLRDGERLLTKIMHLSPLGTHQELSLYNKFTTTASSTIRGTILIGGIQGLLGGIMLAVAGIDSAIIWGIIMVFMSVIPGAGTSLIWIPAALYLLLTHQIWQGIFVIIFGTLIISTIDNLLRPVLVGKHIQMHPLVIVFSTLGGIALFGISGFLIGPIIASLFLAFWDMYEEYYRNELASN